jgi:serine/threonine protein kinase
MQNKPDLQGLIEVLPGIQEIDFCAEGGFKAVYKARIGNTHEALKVIYVPTEEEEKDIRDEIVARVKREINSLAICTCPYLVKLGSVQPQLYIIGGHEYIVYTEEFLDGQSILEMIRADHRPNLQECKMLFRCLLETIKEFKVMDLIHRDIKPGNIMHLGQNDRPYVVLDLGIAFKLYGTPITMNPEMRQGTLPYMAPEMFTPRFREMLDYRSDLYSAAVTIYEFVSGVHPVARRGEDDFTTMFRIMHMKPVPLIDHRPDLPKAFCQMIDGMIRKKPALRPSNIERTLHEMEAIP